jgi:hypothetical protein
VHVVGRLGFEQLGVRENDPELIVQLMKEQPQRCGFLTGVGRVHESKPHHGASGAAIVPDVASPAAASERRHSESSKILTAPPAVRTYCTLPADIQL